MDPFALSHIPLERRESKRKRGWRRLDRLILGLSLLFMWTMAWVYYDDHLGSLYDGAYIYLRHVDNLLSGCGLRFNCGGPAVESFGSPLYFAVLLVGKLLVSDLERLAQLIGLLSMAAALSLTLLLARQPRWHQNNRLSPILGSLGLVLLLGLDHYLLVQINAGVETALVSFLVCLLCYALFLPQKQLFQLCLALLVWARPEALAFCAAALLLPFARKRHFWLPIASALGALLALRLLFFQSVVPHAFWTHLRLDIPGGLGYAFGVLGHFPWILLSPLALLLPQTRRAVGFVLAAAGGWLLLLALGGGEQLPYSRLAVPLILPLTALAMIGVFAAIHKANEELPSIYAAYLPWLNSVLVLASMFWLWPTHTFPEGSGFAEIKQDKALAAHLRRHFPKKKVAAASVGALGYFSKLQVMEIPPAATVHSVVAQKPHVIVTGLQGKESWKRSKPKKKPHRLRQSDGPTAFEKRLMQLCKSKQIPYTLHRAEISPGMYRLLAIRKAR